MKTWVALIILCPLFLSYEACLGHDGRGGISLDPPISTRSISLGETGLTDIDNAEGFMTNASCLPFLSSGQIGLGHGNLIEGVTSSRTLASLVVPLGERTEYPGQGFTGHRYGLGLSFDHSGVKLAQGTDWSSETISMGFGYAVATYASVGILSKLLLSRSDLENAGVKAYGIDIGTHLDLYRWISLGLVVRNMAGKTIWDEGQGEELPIILNFGGRLTWPKLIRTEFSMALADGSEKKLGVGVDIPVLRTGVHLRGGSVYHSGSYSRHIVTAGFGLDYMSYRFDYAVRIDDETAFGVTHRFSVRFALP